MKILYTLLTFIFIISFVSLSYSKDTKSIGQNQKKFDADGFEIISSAPSQEVLDKINRIYLSSVKPIFENKCLDCHGSNSNLPWYHAIPGVKQLMNYDIREARKHIDMANDFPFKGHGSSRDDFEAISRELKNDDMPPLQYKLIHWQSTITKKELKIIHQWIKKSLKLLE